MAFSEVIASLGVSLSLDTAAFQTGSRKAQKEAAGLQTTMGRLTKAVGAVAGAFVIAGGVGAIKGLITDGLAYASSLGEVARQLGVTSTELQEYRYAASQVGIEQEQMDRGLQRLTLTLGQLATGAEAPRKALMQYGVTAEEVDRLSRSTAGEAFPILSAAFLRLKNPTEQAGLAAVGFGAKLGPKFQTLLAEGADGINGLRDAAHELGIVLSEEQIQNADRTADKLNAIKQVLQARIAGVVADNTTSILALADALGVLVTKLGEAVQWWEYFKLKQGEIESRMNAGFYGWSPLASDQRRAEDFEQQRRAFTGRLSFNRNQQATTISSPMFGVGPILIEGNTRPGGVIEGLRRMADGARTLGTEGSAALRDFAEAAEGGARRAGGAARGGANDIEQAAAMIAAIRDRLFPEEAAERQYQEERRRILTLTDEAERLRQINALEAERAAHMAEQADSAEARLKAIGEGFLLKSGFGTDPKDGVHAKFAEVLAGIDALAGRSERATVRVVKSFKDMADETLSHLNQLTSAFKGGGFLGILEAVIGLGLQLGGMGAFGKTIQGRLNAEPRAAGGPIFAGRPYLVGELGPELVVPRHNARVIPNGGFDGVQRVEIVDTTGLFQFRVNGQIMAAAPSIARAGAAGGMALAAHRNSRRLA